jgi:hypothetical protein
MSPSSCPSFRAASSSRGFGLPKPSTHFLEPSRKPIVSFDPRPFGAIRRWCPQTVDRVERSVVILQKQRRPRKNRKWGSEKKNWIIMPKIMAKGPREKRPPSPSAGYGDSLLAVECARTRMSFSIFAALACYISVAPPVAFLTPSLRLTSLKL